MATRTQQARAAEHGLTALEELVEQGDATAAEVALGLIGPGVEALGSPEQQDRLAAARRQIEALQNPGPRPR